MCGIISHETVSTLTAYYKGPQSIYGFAGLFLLKMVKKFSRRINSPLTNPLPTFLFAGDYVTNT